MPISAVKFPKFLGFFFVFLLVTSCVQKKPDFSPQQLAEFNLLSNEADRLYNCGSYTSLKKAFDIYEAHLAFPAYQNMTQRKLVQTALLLALRENELAIVGDRYLTRALELIESVPELSEFSHIAAIVIYSSLDGPRYIRRSSTEKFDLGDYFDWAQKNVGVLNTELKEKADSEIFYAYFYLALNAEFPHNLVDKKDDFQRFMDVFPDSPLIRYKLAVFPKFDRDRMAALVQEEPEFYEAHYFLGNLALMEGNVLTAEELLMQAHEKIPLSVSILTLLTKIHYILEEFEECLEYNERILTLTPEYRDALLGKAICLGYLSRHEEAVDILNRLIELGMYLMGESHYWLAWNQHELGRLEPAWENIKRSLNYLIGHHEVHSLAGLIAFDQNNIEASEDHFKTALSLNVGDCEASFYMGKIYGIRQNWEQSGIHFENSALCNGGMERALLDKIKELEASSLSAARKEKHITRKKIQLKNVQVTKATAFYNAAAGYFNAGMAERALGLAENARENRTIQPMAEELIKKIKEFLPAGGNKN